MEPISKRLKIVEEVHSYSTQLKIQTYLLKRKCNPTRIPFDINTLKIAKITIANGEEQFPVMLVTSDAIPFLFCGHNLHLKFKLKFVFFFFLFFNIDSIAFVCAGLRINIHPGSRQHSHQWQHHTDR